MAPNGPSRPRRVYYEEDHDDHRQAERVLVVNAVGARVLDHDEPGVSRHWHRVLSRETIVDEAGVRRLDLLRTAGSRTIDGGI